MSPGVANLFTILEALGQADTHAALTKDYEAGSLRYVQLKAAVADAVWETAERIQTGKAAYPEERVREILAAGASRAKSLAKDKIAQVRERIGLVSL
jgi:tryptophanyl-tRNA synthetase